MYWATSSNNTTGTMIDTVIAWLTNDYVIAVAFFLFGVITFRAYVNWRYAVPDSMMDVVRQAESIDRENRALETVLHEAIDIMKPNQAEELQVRAHQELEDEFDTEWEFEVEKP